MKTPETQLCERLIAWLAGCGHKSLHQEVMVGGVGTADLVSCDGLIVVFEAKMNKHSKLLEQCDRWHGMAHAVYAVSNSPMPQYQSPVGMIVVDSNVRIQKPPTYLHDYNADIIRKACTEHNAVGGKFAKAGSQAGKRATPTNVQWEAVSRCVEAIGGATASSVASMCGVKTATLLKAVKAGQVPNVVGVSKNGKTYLEYVL